MHRFIFSSRRYKEMKTEGLIEKGRFKDLTNKSPLKRWSKTDYAMVRAGGQRGDMRLGDGGQAAVHDGAGFEETIKRLWLFVRASLLPRGVSRHSG